MTREQLDRMISTAIAEERAVIDSARYGYAHYCSEMDEHGWRDVLVASLKAAGIQVEE